MLAESCAENAPASWRWRAALLQKPCLMAICTIQHRRVDEASFRNPAKMSMRRSIAEYWMSRTYQTGQLGEKLHHVTVIAKLVEYGKVPIQWVDLLQVRCLSYFLDILGRNMCRLKNKIVWPQTNRIWQVRQYSRCYRRRGRSLVGHRSQARRFLSSDKTKVARGGC